MNDSGPSTSTSSANAAPSVPVGGRSAKKRARGGGPVSCGECRRRKITCDRLRPCGGCSKGDRAHLCVFDDGEGGGQEVGGPSASLETARSDIAVLQGEVQASKVREGALVEQLKALERRVLCVEFQASSSSSLPRPPPAPYSPPVARPDAGSAFEASAIELEQLALGSRRTQQLQHSNPENVSAEGHPFSPPPDYILASTPLSPRRHALFRSTFDELPLEEALDWCVKLYWEEIEWSWHLLHRPTFELEYELFRTLRQAGRLSEVDPLWLASLFALLALAVGDLDGEEEFASGEIVGWQKARGFWEASLACLEAGDWTGSFTILTVQALCLLSAFFSYSGDADLRARVHIYLAAASRICQHLQLHHLGYHSSTMPPLPDKALPAGVNSLRRERALRLLYSVQLNELMVPSYRPALHPSLMRCSLPSNVDDSALSAVSSLVTASPSAETTDVSCELLKYSLAIVDSHFGDVSARGGKPSYDDILKFDQQYRQLLEDLPLGFREDAPSSLLISQPRYRTWQRAMVLAAIYERLLKVHRLHALQGYTINTHRYSTTIACATSRKTLQLHVDAPTIPLLRAVRHFIRIQNAAIILTMQLWVLFHPSQVSSLDFLLLRSLYAILEPFTTSARPEIKRAAVQTTLVVRFLDHLLTQRFEGRAPNPPPSFPAVLHVIARQVRERIESARNVQSIPTPAQPTAHAQAPEADPHGYQPPTHFATYPLPIVNGGMDVASGADYANFDLLQSGDWLPPTLQQEDFGGSFGALDGLGGAEMPDFGFSL